MSKGKKNKSYSNKTSKSGEMVPSMFNWVTPDIQSHIANKLANVTKNKSD